MSVRLQNTDKGLRRLLRKRFRKDVDVGILGGSHSAGLSNVELGTIHEFGSEHIPRRSFIRATIDKNQAQIQAQLDKALREFVYQSARPEHALGKVGALVEGMIKERISDGIPPPNAQSTIDRKGSSTPLIDTGQLRNSIAFRVNP